jgi:hypothetical protein
MAQEDGHHNLLLGEGVASPTPRASRCPPSRGATRTARRRPAPRASVAHSVPAPNGPLMAARELLRNPPGEAASADVQRLWRDDVDYLLNLAHASPSSAGGSASRQHRHQGGASGSVHSPSVRSARTEDLRGKACNRQAHGTLGTSVSSILKALLRGNLSFVIGTVTVRTRAVEVRPRKPGPLCTSRNFTEVRPHKTRTNSLREDLFSVCP